MLRDRRGDIALYCYLLHMILQVGRLISYFFFFFNDPAPPEISPLPLHDPLPISSRAEKWNRSNSPSNASRQSALLQRIGPSRRSSAVGSNSPPFRNGRRPSARAAPERSEEHTSELQSQSNLVCRLLLEKKKKYTQ